jgi:Sec-independent protein translocase protein TatA
MKFIRLALELLALYLIYKFIFDFIIPVAKTSKQVKKQFGDMNAQMQENLRQQQQAQANSTTQKEPVKAAGVNKDDYIDFEEIK